MMINNTSLENVPTFPIFMEKETHCIELALQSQYQLKTTVLNTMQKFADSVEHIPVSQVDTIWQFLNNLKNALQGINENMAALEELQTDLETFPGEPYRTEQWAHWQTKRLEVFEKVWNNTLVLETGLESILQYTTLSFQSEEPEELPSMLPPSLPISSDMEETAVPSSIVERKPIADISTISAEPTVMEEIPAIPPTPPCETTTSPTQEEENVLIVSENKGKVCLPYHVADIENLLQSQPKRYASKEDIIQKLYTLPIEQFRNPAVARFREAFKLMRHKEKTSIKAAFDLGMELLWNYNLHPAIIAGCRNKDELDIYLDYLEDNETDKFDCFKIVFDIAPVVVKNKK